MKELGWERVGEELPLVGGCMCKRLPGLIKYYPHWLYFCLSAVGYSSGDPYLLKYRARIKVE